MKKQKKQSLLNAIIIILVLALVLMIGSIVYEEIIERNKQPIQNTNAPDINENIDIEKEENDGDGLNFLAGKPLSFVNQKAFEGTVLAHTDGGVPNLVISIDKADEDNLGRLIYFFEKACAISGYMLGVNPFDQPGVESYKKNMFALLGKPGYEDMKAELEARLSK